MGYDIQKFNNDNIGASIRVMRVDDDFWFVAKDACKGFGDSHYRRAIGRLDDDEKGVTHMDTPGGKQKMVIVNEAGLYSLLFSMQPQKSTKNNSPEIAARIEKLRQFKRWVTHDVLPSIRKTGFYATEATTESILSNPDHFIAVLKAYKEEKKNNAELEAKNTALVKQRKKDMHKIAFSESVMGSATTISIGEVAKTLNIKGIGQNRLFSFLRYKRILMSNNIPYQKYVDIGYFRCIEQKYTHKGETRISLKTVVFQKGLKFIKEIIDKAKAENDLYDENGHINDYREE